MILHPNESETENEILCSAPGLDTFSSPKMKQMADV